LWFEASLPRVQLAAWSALVVVMLWTTGAVMQGRLRIPAALAIEAAALALVLAWQPPGPLA
jgi:hypothetical protein